MQNRNSAQRSLILNIMDGNKSHPTADEIYDEARKQDSHISRGTVYRNLNLLVENGLLLRIPVPGQADHFDSTLSDHYHFYCRECNRVFDVPDFDVEGIKAVEKSLEEQGFESVCHKIVFEGTCPDCCRKNEKSAG
ncbi:MAG: transcriptional repressor [Treponema sp.]|nr:transcriptional repressor [Treponema sp.]